MAALSHAKSVTVGDATGTVTFWNGATTSSIAASDLGRPSDWNSAHNFFQTISGNTAGQSTASGTNLVWAGTNGITVSHATAAGAATAWISGPGPTPPQYFVFVGEDIPQARALITNATALTQRPLFFPFDIGGNLTAQEVHWTMSRSTSGSNNFTVHVGIYSYVNSTQLTSISTTSASYSNTATASVSGVRAFEAPLPVTTLAPGQYVLGMIFSATATASMNYSLMGGTTSNFPNSNVIVSGADVYHTYTSHGAKPFWGRYTTTTGALPGSVGYTQVIHAFTAASMPLPVHFEFANHY